MSGDGWDRLARNVGDGRLSRRRAIGAFVAGGTALAVPWAFPRRAHAADCGTYCASGGGCNPPTSGCCCFDTAPGVINVCGCYDPETQECFYDTAAEGCVVRGKPGDDCEDGAPRCGDKCCELGEQCCGDKTCCPQGDRCCGEICCKHKESCCKDECCKKGQKCVDAIGKGDVKCCDPGRVHIQGGRKVCCPPGTVSTSAGCCPKNDKDCCGELPPLGRKKVCVKGKVKKI
jgi:hypothetical protein